MTGPGQELATRYIEGVRSGEIPAGKWIWLAVKRHVRDLETGHERGLAFDVERAEHVIAFFHRFLRHYKGKWAGQRFELQPWQAFVLWCLFGWVREDGTRRYRMAYLEVPRKNGKSTLAAGIALYLLAADGEAGADVYALATKRDQARIVWGDAKRMVQRSPALRREIVCHVANMAIEETASKFEPLGSDVNTLDGLNPHGAIIDELHAHGTRDLWDVITSALGARAEPLVLAITTAGRDPFSVCREQHDYGENILEEVIEDDSYFAFIATIDEGEEGKEGDDWQDPATWAKANPNLGTSLSFEYLEDQFRRARASPAAQNAAKRYHLNVWTQQAGRAIALQAWDRCDAEVDLEALRDLPCYGGLDLANTRDIAAFVLVWALGGGRFAAWPWFWVPAEWRDQATRQVPYKAWIRDGWLDATPGDIIDHDYICERVEKLADKFDLRQIAFDRWGSTQVQKRLGDAGLELVGHGQGFASMSAPTTELLALVRTRKLAHGGHPVLRWMANNLVTREDASGNLKPDRAKSRDKIDGIVALIMGIDRATRDEGEGRSVYEERGIITVG